MLVWESSYKIDQKDMDSEHLVLFALLNQLDININEDLSAECVEDILSALTSYIDYHFAHEEALMRKAGFPELDAHIAMHRSFCLEVEQLRVKLKDREPLQAALKVRSLVLEWLLGHILEVDAQYAKYMKENGAV